MVFRPHTEDSEYSLPTPSCERFLERRSLVDVRSENKKKRFFFCSQNADFLMLTRVAGVFLVIAALLWVYSFTTLAKLKSLLSPYCTLWVFLTRGEYRRFR
jgi:hypothetical protein